MTSLHRRWTSGEAAPAGLNAVDSIGIIATSNHRPIGYVLASPPHGLARAARRAGWSETGCVWISRTVWILENLVVKPETTGSAAVGAQLVRTLVDDLSAATAKQGHLYGSTPDRPELVQFWREAGFDVGSPNTPTFWNYPECETLRHKEHFPGHRSFAHPLGREFSLHQAFKKGVVVD
ncbi:MULTISPECIES: hypothetical protein [Rhodococcus]|nr:MULTISPECIES: hypothetical protein [Rhodococcus]MCD2136026.1 hypothetical protein [Rhodococcus qingshengii]